jgi:hypothetical protein
MHAEIFAELQRVARRRRLTTYSDIAPLAGLDMDVDVDRDRMSAILEEIARHQEEEGLPMLTAVVVHRGNDNNPGEGFFAIAEEFGRFEGGRNQLVRLEFWVREVGRVHDHRAKE